MHLAPAPGGSHKSQRTHRLALKKWSLKLKIRLHYKRVQLLWEQ